MAQDGGQPADDYPVARRLTLFGLVLLLLGGCGSDSTPSASPTTGVVPAGPSQTPQRGPASTRSDPGDPDDSQPACAGEVIFEHPPVDLDAVEYLVPFGLMTGSHVTPVDHHYFQNFVEPEREIAVYAPGTGKVVSIQHFGVAVTENPEELVDDFRLVIEHTCTVSSIFIHIDELIPRLAVHDPGIGNQASIDVDVEAGELIGTFTANVDFNLVDLDHTVEGLINPVSYQREPWKIHVPDTLDYFTADISKRLLGLSPRTAEPRLGRFAYDIDSRLVGNWFEDGTNGYAGIGQERYWAGHLTFAYDHLDPSMIVVSIGTFEGRSSQFAVLDNGPDPAEISVDSGVVVYELVGWDYTINGERWDRFTFATDIEATPGRPPVKGVIAVQLVGQRELLVEVLPGATAADFAGFGPHAKLYTR